jgi:hypothetical protein
MAAVYRQFEPRVASGNRRRRPCLRNKGHDYPVAAVGQRRAILVKDTGIGSIPRCFVTVGSVVEQGDAIIGAAVVGNLGRGVYC